MKKIITSLCYVSLMTCLLFATSCNDENESERTYIISFNNILTSDNSEYRGPEEGDLEEGIYYYESTFTDPTNLASFSHFALEGASYFGGGFTYTNKNVDSENITYTNSSAITGKGVSGNTYLIANNSSFTPAIITLKKTGKVEGCYLTNSSYAYYVMKNGNEYAKKFDTNDYLKLTIIGKSGGVAVSNKDFYLAKDGNIVNTWEWVDLSALGEIDELHFDFDSSDKSEWAGEVYLNTPTYFCMDGLTVVVAE